MARKNRKRAKSRVRFSFRPFVLVAAVVGVLGAGASVALSSRSSEGSGAQALTAFLILWAASCLNLGVLGKAGLKVMEWMRHSGQNHSPELMIQVFFWGLMKFGCLILLGSLIWRSRSVPGMTLVLGLSTLVLVPLFGGYLWSRTEYARRTWL